MALTKNGRVIFKEFPGSGYVTPGKTVVYDESEVLDIETVSLDGGVLLRMLSFSLDPYLRHKMIEKEQRPYERIPSFVPGEPISNSGVGVVLRSESPEFKSGDHVLSDLPLQNYVIVKELSDLRKIENKEGLPWTAYLGVCGMPGQTAHHGWVEFAHPKPGEVCFVSAASGAVGSVVVQLAKAAGCKVIASAGSDEKVAFVSSLGADVAFNYKTVPTRKVLEKEGPVDIYWDNVGGETLEAALDFAAPHTRVIVCGSISNYNTAEPYNVKNLQLLLWKEIHLYGFLVFTLAQKHAEAFFRDMPKQVASGEIKYKEHIVRGLEQAPQGIVDIHLGNNFGKSVLIVADE